MYAPLITGEIVSSLIGRDLISTAIHDVSSKIYNILTLNIYNNYPEIKSLFETLDIKAKISILNKLISELDDKKENESVHLCLNYLHQTIDKIHDLIDSINKELEMHSKRYFYYWRYPNCYSDMDKLKLQSNILDKRTEMLSTILSVKHNI
tara:strand:+ start:2192 stop:2644 length:453 start_codon:yes stop_codon:yes gene_type:complete